MCRGWALFGEEVDGGQVVVFFSGLFLGEAKLIGYYLVVLSNWMELILWLCGYSVFTSENGTC